MTDKVLARIVALKSMPIDQLKKTWRDLYSTEPPAYNRRFLENRLAYRLQELAYGGLKTQHRQTPGAVGRTTRWRKEAGAQPAYR